MAITLVVEDGSGLTTSNTYVSLADAEDVLAGEMRTATWDLATDDQKNRALVTACRIMDSLVYFVGTRASETQALSWPRINAVTTDGYSVEEDEVPLDVIRVNALLARDLVHNDTTAPSDWQGLTEVVAGDVEIKFDRNDRATAMPAYTISTMRRYVAHAPGYGVARAKRTY